MRQPNPMKGNASQHSDSVCGAERGKMRRLRFMLCLVLSAVMLIGLSTAAFAAADTADDVEDVVDAVAKEEADAAAAAEKAIAEAQRMNDVIDLDAKPESVTAEETTTVEVSESDSGVGFAISGPIRALIVAVVLITFGFVIIAASNRKIKSGRKAR